MLRTTLSGLFLAALALTACSKSDSSRPEEPIGICPPVLPTPPGSGIAPGGCVPPIDDSACAAVMCTADFRMVTLQVTDVSGTPLTLDSFVVVDASGTPLPLISGVAPYGPTGTPGTYAIITDAWTGSHHNQSLSVTAKGFYGTQSFSHATIISADCCHVSGSSVTTIALAVKP